MPVLAKHDPAVPLTEIKTAWEEIELMPIQCSDGSVFQYGDKDEKRMKKALVFLTDNPGVTLDWRLLDNTEVTVDSASLGAYISELESRQLQRGFVLNQEYMVFKTSGCTRSQLNAWKDKYSSGLVP